MPLTLEKKLHPLRPMLRAQEDIRTKARFEDGVTYDRT